MFLFVVSAKGQVPDFEWAKKTGAAEGDYTVGVATDANGNVFSTGVFQGTADMDPGPAVYNMTSRGTIDIFITKYNAAGNFIWSKQIGNDYVLNEGIRALAVDLNGNVYITGYFYQTLDFDPGPGVFNITCTGTGYAAYLLKLDNNGNFQWAKNIAQSDYGNIGYSIATANSGNVYVLGTFRGLTDLDPGPAQLNINSVNEAQDIFISKFDNAGNFIWSKQFLAMTGQVGYSIKVDGQENIYTAGLFTFTSDFDPGPGVYNLVANNQLQGTWQDGFISKLDVNGNFVWARHISGERDEICYSLALDPFGNILVTGEFSGPTDFDPGPGTFLMGGDGYAKAFVLKLTVAGTFVWVRQFSGPTGSTSQGFSIACDVSGDVYTTGGFYNAIDFDPGNNNHVLTTPGPFNYCYLSKLTADGNFVFAEQIGDGQSALGQCLTVDASKNIYVSGFFMGSPDFDPSDGTYILTSNGSIDGYVLKLSQCFKNTEKTIKAAACNSYTLNNQVYTSSGTYFQTLKNVAGCDSTITLELTLGGSADTTTVTACENYAWEGRSYTTSGSYTVSFPGSDGCDSLRTLNLIIRNSVFATLDLSLCEGENYQGYTTSGTYIDHYAAANGCDSIRTLHLVVNKKSYQVFNVNLCEGNTYWGHSISGIYMDTLINANGCDSVRTLSLLIYPTIQTSSNISICEGKSYFAGGANQKTSGIYSDAYMSYLGCDSIIITNLTVLPLPVPNLGSDRNLCKGSTIQLNPGLFYSYEWQDQSTLETFVIADTGIYWIKVKDVNQCTGTDSITIAKSLPLPGNFLQELDSICQYEKLQLRPAGDYQSYLWSTGSMQSSIVVDHPGNYILEVQDGFGCYGKDTINVYSKTCRTGVFIPTAFTPNSDQLNDTFRATVNGELLSFQLQVYNRWGELVFMSNDPGKAWNGKVKGKDTDTAVFVWKCRYQLKGDKLIDQKGTVTLIR
ncbi:MAG: gliding motility-associated C-terminal domain-containing protein [Chitinophagaceae bacterium]